MAVNTFTMNIELSSSHVGGNDADDDMFVLQGENTLCVSQWARRVGEVHRAYIGQCCCNALIQVNNFFFIIFVTNIFFFLTNSSWSAIHDIISSMTNICFHIFALAHHKSVCLFTAVFLLPAPPWSARNLATAASFFAQNIPPTKRTEQIFRSCHN